MNKKKIVYKRELREAIINNINENKNARSLKKLLIITDIERRVYDEELCQSATSHEWKIWSVITSLINTDEKTLGEIKVFVNGYLQGTSTQKEKKAGG